MRQGSAGYGFAPRCTGGGRRARIRGEWRARPAGLQSNRCCSSRRRSDRPPQRSRCASTGGTWRRTVRCVWCRLRLRREYRRTRAHTRHALAGKPRAPLPGTPAWRTRREGRTAAASPPSRRRMKHQHPQPRQHWHRSHREHRTHRLHHRRRRVMPARPAPAHVHDRDRDRDLVRAWRPGGHLQPHQRPRRR